MVAERYAGSAGDEADGELNEESVEQFRSKLAVIAARRLGDWAAADDVAQEAMHRALEAIRARRIPNRRALSGFLVQTAIHICLHYRRSAGREGRALNKYAASAPPAEPDALSGLISKERRKQVREAFGKLAEEDREILTLTYFEAVPTPQIAVRLTLSEGNVRVRRHRALKRLAEILRVTRDGNRGLTS